MRAFLAVADQWRALVLPDGTIAWLGLDSSGVRASLALAGITLPPDAWDEVQQIATGALEELNRDRRN